MVVIRGSSLDNGFVLYESNFETRFKNLEIGTRKNGEVKCTYLQSVHLRRNLKKVPSNLSKISQ